jgi:hypothetical protein
MNFFKNLFCRNDSKPFDLQKRYVQPPSYYSKTANKNLFELSLLPGLRKDTRYAGYNVNKLVTNCFFVIQDEVNGGNYYTKKNKINVVQVKVFLKENPTLEYAIENICRHRIYWFSRRFSKTASKLIKLLHNQNSSFHSYQNLKSKQIINSLKPKKNKCKLIKLEFNLQPIIENEVDSV